MPFIYKETFSADSTIPGRLYVHSAGFDEVFEGRIAKPREYFTETISKTIKRRINRGSLPQDFSHIIATVWGDPLTKQRRADLFFYTGIQENWGDNPTVIAMPLNGTKSYITNGEITCEDVTIMLGREAELRRRTQNISEYLKSEVKITDLPWSPRLI